MLHAGRPENTEVTSNFLKRKDPIKKTNLAQCKHCNHERSWHTTALAQHLQHCVIYQERKAEKQPILHKVNSDSQLHFKSRKIPTERTNQMSRKLALACYMNNRPFTCYEDPYTLAAFGSFGVTCKMPSKKELGGPLLEGELSSPKRDEISVNSSRCTRISSRLDFHVY